MDIKRRHSLESVFLRENSYFEALFSVTLNLISLTMPEKWDTIVIAYRNPLSLFIIYVYFTLIYPGILSSDQFPALMPAAHWLGHYYSDKFCLLPHPIKETLITTLVLTSIDLINFNEHANHLLNRRFWFSRSGLKPKFCVPNQLRRNSAALGLKTTLCATRIWVTVHTALYIDSSRLKILDKPSKWNSLCFKYTLSWNHRARYLLANFCN